MYSQSIQIGIQREAEVVFWTSDKVIMDTCCFNGYFSFKALENGAKKVIGIDQNKPALKICNKLCIYNNYHIWINGKKLIILVN